MHACAVLTTGALMCRGANTTGRLGDGNAWKVTPGYGVGFQP